ncbi:MAG: hypothetical protein ACO1SV_17560 [Fimbriimonas sp.]
MTRRWLLALPLLLALSGCGGSSSSKPTAQNFAYTADLTSQSTNLKQLDNGTKVAGWNQLVGTTTLDGATVGVEMQGNVAYTNGNGPFFGFLTVTRPDESILTMRMDGRAVRDADTGNTAFTCDLEVLGGTGIWNGAKGEGSFTGTRNASLGGVVSIDVRARVE